MIYQLIASLIYKLLKDYYVHTYYSIVLEKHTCRNTYVCVQCKCQPYIMSLQSTSIIEYSLTGSHNQCALGAISPTQREGYRYRIRAQRPIWLLLCDVGAIASIVYSGVIKWKVVEANPLFTHERNNAFPKATNRWQEQICN